MSFYGGIERADRSNRKLVTGTERGCLAAMCPLSSSEKWRQLPNSREFRSSHQFSDVLFRTEESTVAAGSAGFGPGEIYIPGRFCDFKDDLIYGHSDRPVA